MFIIPAGAVQAPVNVQIIEVNASSGPTPNLSTFTLGSVSIDVKVSSITGASPASTQLDSPSEVCLPYTPTDGSSAAGGVNGIGIYRYNYSSRQWTALTTVLDYYNQRACAYTDELSLFALGLRLRD